MPVTRVFVMGLTTMLSEVVRAVIASRPTLALVGESPTADFVRAAGATPHVVVAGRDGLAEADVVTFLRAYGPVEVVTLGADGRTATCWELRPHRTDVAEVGVETLAGLLDRATGDG